MLYGIEIVDKSARLPYTGFMSDKLNGEKNLVFNINDPLQHADICRLAKALSTPDRIKIMYALQTRPMYLVELADQLRIPVSSVSRYIDALAEAQLLYISYTPGPKGHSKLCSKAVLDAQIQFKDASPNDKTEPTVSITEMPIGMYTECHITPPCGLVGQEEPLSDFDTPMAFYDAKRAKAELLWFNTGYVAYRFPLKKVPPPKKSRFRLKSVRKLFTTAKSGRATLPSCWTA